MQRIGQLFFLVGLLGSVSSAFSDDLWKKENNAAAPQAGVKFNIDASGAATGTADTTIIQAFSASGCSGFMGSSSNSNTVTFHSNTIVQISATKLYTLLSGHFTPGNVHSIWVFPTRNGGATHTFDIINPCFNITCSGSSCVSGSTLTTGLT